MSEIAISVGLVTRNRPDSLERALKSWRAQKPQPLEIIVSDDSENEAQTSNKEISQRFGAQWIEGPHRGLYANRNHVVNFCRGTHIRTADDDHELPPGHFDCCHRSAVADSSAVWVVGEYLPGQTSSVEMPHPSPGQLTPRGFAVAPTDSQNSWALSDGASVIPRAVFDRGLRYADQFKFGASYLEFGSMLHACGFRIRHLAETYVIHHYSPETRSFASRQIDIESRLFAILCHSFIYQPTVKNKFLTAVECARETGFLGRGGIRIMMKALSAFRLRRRQFIELCSGSKQAPS